MNKMRFLFVLCILVFVFLVVPSVTAGLVQLANDSGVGESYYVGWRDGDIVGAVLTPDPGWYYPVEVESVEVALYQFSGAWGYAMVKAHVYSIVDGLPGQLLGSSETVQVEVFYPEWASISLTNVTLGNQSFMVAIEYVAGAGGSTPAVLLDDQDNIPVGKNFYYWPPTWHEHYDFWVDPEVGGYNMIRVTLDVPDEPPDPTATPTPTPYFVYLPEVMRNFDPLAPTPAPTATHTPIWRPTALPTITPMFYSPLGVGK